MASGPRLQRFLTALDECLAQLSADEILAALRMHARALTADQRNGFLGIFTGDAPPATPSELPGEVVFDPLLDEIDQLVDRIRSGSYVAGFGWDEESYAERACGDDSWAQELDGRFDDAHAAFLAGDFGLARAAYQRLLRAFDLDGDVGTFTGEVSPAEMVSTDLGEASARYLRSVYETTMPAERATTLVGEWFDLPIWELPSLAALREALPADLPALDGFLGEWIAALRSVDVHVARTRPLLAEAVEAQSGPDGLAELAREPGELLRAERYLDWLDALDRAGRVAEIPTAAREALAELEPTGQSYAVICERLARAAAHDPAERLQACRLAWRAAPTDARLLALHAAAGAELDDVLAGELAALGPDPLLSRRLEAVLLILAGHPIAAATFVADMRGALAGGSADLVVMSYLLAVSSGGPNRPTWSSSKIARLLADVDSQAHWDRSADPRGDFPESASLAALLADRARADAADPQLANRCLVAARDLISSQVHSIVSGKHRRQYAQAAALVMGCAEAIEVADSPAAAGTFTSGFRASYPRHVAFRRELDQAARQQPGQRC